MARTTKSASSRTKKNTPPTRVKKSAKAANSAAAKTKAAATKPAAKSKLAAKSAQAGKVIKKVPKTTHAGSLRKLHLLAAILHFAQGIAIIILSKAYTLPLTLGYLAPDTLRSAEGQELLVAAQKTIWDVNLAYVLAAVFFVSAAAHFLWATVLRQQYENNLKTGVHPGRWLHHGLATGLLFAALAMLAGLQSLGVLLGILGLALASGMFALVFEIQNQAGGKVQWLGLKLAYAKVALIWVILAVAVVGTLVYGMASLPVYLYALLASMLVLSKLFIWLVYMRYKRGGKWADTALSERRLLAWNLVLNAAIAWQVYAALLVK